jgi:hypothetical protein
VKKLFNSKKKLNRNFFSSIKKYKPDLGRCLPASFGVVVGKVVDWDADDDGGDDCDGDDVG